MTMQVRQLPLDLGHRPARGREDFLVAPSNADAIAWLDRWPDWPGPSLAIYGPAGCGKSHLAEVWRTRSGAAFVSTEQVATMSPIRILEHGDCCIVEDADRGVDAEALLHLYNLVAERRGSILLTGRTAPARWAVGLADLASRLAATPAVPVQAPDDALMSAVLIKLFADRQITPPPEVVTFLVPRMERSFQAARTLVDTTDRTALAGKRQVTVPLVRDVLAKINDDSEGT